MPVGSEWKAGTWEGESMQLTRGLLGSIGDFELPLAVSDTAKSTQIDPGFNAWATQPETTVDLGPVGIVPLQGDPLSGLGDTDTIVERLNGSVPFNVGHTDTIDIISGNMLGEPANHTVPPEERERSCGA